MKDNAVLYAAPGGSIPFILRLEALFALLAAVGLYRWLDGGWGIFFALFLAPDLTMLGYLRNRRFGAVAYNVGHTYAVPAVVASTMWLISGQPSPLFLVWFAHIAFDRLMGYGLKSSEGFRFTHLKLLPEMGPAHSVSNNPI